MFTMVSYASTTFDFVFLCLDSAELIQASLCSIGCRDVGILLEKYTVSLSITLQMNIFFVKIVNYFKVLS